MKRLLVAVVMLVGLVGCNNQPSYIDASVAYENEYQKLKRLESDLEIAIEDAEDDVANMGPEKRKRTIEEVWRPKGLQLRKQIDEQKLKVDAAKKTLDALAPK